MTDDIVARLRDTKRQRTWWPRDRLEAADEIERLRAALRKIACDGEPYDKCHCVNSDECSYGVARAALAGEKKNDVAT